ncbi:MAG: hypothetical protein NVS4B11_37880 [Ktedonobacteraceae bacterium]
MDSPQVFSIQVPAINHDAANLCLLTQIALGLLQQRDQPTPLILLDFDQFHRQWQAHLDLDEDQPFPPIHVIFLGRRFFLSFDFDTAGLLQLAAALIALRSGQFASIESHQQLALEEASPSE